MDRKDPLVAPIKADLHKDLGGVQVDVMRAGNGRVKRMVYPPGFNWAKDLKPIVGTDHCMHSHVGFMAHGQINIQFADGCIEEFIAPMFVSVEPGHVGWVVGDEPAVLIEFDFEGETVEKLNVPRVHNHTLR
jgi:hypothetical protein